MMSMMMMVVVVLAVMAVMTMLVMAVMTMLMMIRRALITILKLALNKVRSNCTTNRTQQPVFLLVSEVISRCATRKRTAQAAISPRVSVLPYRTFIILVSRIWSL